MKTEEELREWFWNMFNSCYRIESKIKGNYILFYNKGYARKKNIQSLLGNELEVPKEELSDSKLLFEIDYKNGYLRCSYDEIWSFFKENTSYNYLEISDLIKGILESVTKLRSLTAVPRTPPLAYLLEDDAKLRSLTPFSHR